MNAVLLAVAILSTSIVPPDIGVVAIDRCDLAELNHFHDEDGRLVFHQVIYYSWCPDDCRFHVRAWRLATANSDRIIPGRVPVRDSLHGGYRTLFSDGEYLRSIFSSAFRESWTQTDIELSERQILPREFRRELSKPIKSEPAP